MSNNLPPGCSASSIPGNSPDDIAFDKFCEELTAITDRYNWETPDPQDGRLLPDVLWEKMQQAYDSGLSQGYALARADARYGDGGW
jgi:hypothetical protein